MIDKLEINHLRMLAALYKHGTLSAAAGHLGVSQQATSLQLKKLRALLRDPLFVRTGHGMAATPYARLIEPHIGQVLAHISAIPLPGSVTPAQIERTLAICATDYTQKVIVGPLLRELRVLAPKVKIIVSGIEVNHLTQKMQRGEIDLAFTSDGYVPAGLISEPLFIEQYRCVSADQAMFAGGVMALDQLVGYDFIITSPGIGSFKGSADTWFERQGLRRKVVMSAPSFFMAMDYLMQSSMVGFIPTRLLPCDGLFDIPLEKYPPGYEVVAAYHPSANNDPFLRWLLERVRLLSI
ncbi:LysR family transcriptional regulator [Massilia violaceinigra]|uniref:LysR family transcriptional regulator n=1 Tax=Massilia violaceinigra TaxID=2045208 RepID=A0ABY4A0H7_9BURK|nr:LysR family transcriptional regulator [Massilia violaceinigra]UOD28201.1 LysR family transcriptional regulator [Massilia violaceinigra]